MPISPSSSTTAAARRTPWAGCCCTFSNERLKATSPAPTPGARRPGLAAASVSRSMTPDEYCQQKAASSGSSFYYSFLFLPPERRRAITALYAFCREVDDVVDEGMDPQVAAAKLAWWRAEVANLFAGNARHPVTKALDPFRDRFSIDEENLGEIIAGMETDPRQTRYLD